MMCENCGAKPATVHARIIVNGKASERWLCRQCWESENAGGAHPFSINDLFAGFVQQPQAQTPTCPACGTDLRTFRKTGLLGCPRCYDAFADALEPTLRRIHGKSVHTGKRPLELSGAAAGGQAQAAPQSELDKLRDQLAQAIAKEAYEQAAELRDRIRELSAEVEHNA